MVQRVTAFFAAIYLLITGFIAAPSQYYFTDWQALRALKPGSVASEYITKLRLSEKSKLIIAGSNLEIKPKSDFNAACKPVGQVIELGCYIGGLPDHIYVMQIQDPKVQKVMDVTTTHELLHAAYARLTPQKKAEVDALLEKQLSTTTDANLTKRLEGYATTEPGQQNNELHSIFGSEFRNLTPELETYYKQYFNDRLMIVAWSEANNAYITGKERDLKSKKASIESDDAKLKSLEALMNSYLNSGQTALYNSLVPSQNKQVRDINEAIEAYNEDITAYNDLIASVSNRSYSSFDQVK